MKIHTYDNNPRVWKALIAAKYNGIDNVEVTSGFVMGKDNKTKEFLALNPLGKVPTMETEQGPIWESNAIARFIAESNDSGKLFGNNAYERALVNQWIDWVGSVDLPAAVWLYPILKVPGVVASKQATAKAKGEIRKSLTVLNQHLQSRTFMVGERVTLADITIACHLSYLYMKVLDGGFRKQFTNVNRWFNTCVNQPNFKSVMGEVKLCEKMAVADYSAAPAGGNKKKEQQKKKEKKPQQQQPAQQKKKEKNPLDLLPPSKFVLDEWKRKYSNCKESDLRSDAMKWFWENYDAEGYSLWFGKYKYNDELEKAYMTCNLIGGFKQRLQSLMKYGFGNILIMGKEGEGMEIICCFLVRGTGLCPELGECPDAEHYDWRKIDHTSPTEKELVEDIWIWEGNFPGQSDNMKTVVDGKVFK